VAVVAVVLKEVVAVAVAVLHTQQHYQFHQLQYML
jgi:hypothetical protein